MKEVLFKRNVGLLFGSGGDVKEIDTPSLEQAQKIVGGYVEMVQFSRDGIAAQAIVNEDGLRLEQSFNEMASVLVGRPLVGPVIVLTGSKRWT